MIEQFKRALNLRPWRSQVLTCAFSPKLAYANFLATEWKADQEFAKSKGWIKSYMVFGNAYPRKGEPDLYLVVISERLPSGTESEKRDDEYLAWKKKTQAQLVKDSGNRLEVREIETNSLWQELKFHK